MKRTNRIKSLLQCTIVQGLLKEPFSGFSTQLSSQPSPSCPSTNGDFPCRQPFFLSCVNDDDADAGDDVAMMMITMMVARMVMIVMAMMMVVIH